MSTVISSQTDTGPEAEANDSEMSDVTVLAKRKPKAAKSQRPGPPEVGPASRICYEPREGSGAASLRASGRQLPSDSLLSFRLLSRVQLHLQHLPGGGCEISPPSQLVALPRKGFIPCYAV